MNFLMILAIAVALAIAIALKIPSRRQTFRLAFNFGLFQFFMPVAGWFAGRGLVEYIQGFDYWVAFGLLAGIGGKMVYEALVIGREEAVCEGDPTCGISLIMLSLATSIDALAVGLSLSLLRVQVVYPAVVIGIVTFVVTGVGMRTGPLLGRLFGKHIEIAGGLILIGIGVKIFLGHIM